MLTDTKLRNLKPKDKIYKCLYRDQGSRSGNTADPDTTPTGCTDAERGQHI